MNEQHESNATNVVVEKKEWVKPEATVEDVAAATQLTAIGNGKDGVACHS